jgi:hypothetical protein
LRAFIGYDGRVNYEEAYDGLLKQLLATLTTVETEESALQFSTQAAQSIRAAAKEIPEFYIGEFLQMLGIAVVQRMQTWVTEGQQAIQDAKIEAASASVQLTARHAAASEAGDRAAQHAIWREREEIQTASQAKIDAVSARTDIFSFQLEAIQKLQSTLGTK